MNGTLKFAAIPVMFVAIWCFVLFLISFFSGWGRLADRYESPRPFMGTLYPVQEARLRGARYGGGAFKLGVDQTGLYLAPMIIFRPFHRPLLIPWNEVQAHRPTADPNGPCRLTFTRFPDISLVLESRMLEHLVHHLQGILDS